MMNRSASLKISTSVLKALPCKLNIKRHSPSILYISASLAMSTSVLKALPGKLDIKSHSPSILYLWTDHSRVTKHIYHKKYEYTVTECDQLRISTMTVLKLYLKYTHFACWVTLYAFWRLTFSKFRFSNILSVMPSESGLIWVQTVSKVINR